MTVETTDTAQDQARAQYESIVQMIAAVECDYERLEELRDIEEGERTQDETEEMIDLEKDAGENQNREDAITAIQEDPLSVEVREGWKEPGTVGNLDDFQILLCTGGPAVRIRGELQDGQPHRAWLEYQDWGTPWTQYFGASQQTLLAYASYFYFGD